MRVDVVTKTVIHCPLPEVAAYAADPDNAPEWYENIDEVQWLTPRPLGVGSRLRFFARFLGRGLEYVYEVATFEPMQRLVMRTADGPFPMETTYVWEEAARGHTRMTLRNRGQPRGFSAIAAPFMSMAMRRANRQDLERLRHILEG